MRRIRKRKIHGEPQPALKCSVYGGLKIGGQNCQPLIGLHALQQVTDLNVSIPVVAIFYIAPLSEQGVGLIEKQHGAAFLAGIENLLQIFFGLTDVFANHGR